MALPQEIRDPAERSRIALTFLGLIDAAKRAPGCELRVGARHPFRHEAIFEQREVRFDFPRELVLGAAVAEQRQEAQNELAEWSHWSLPLFLPEGDDGIDSRRPGEPEIHAAIATMAKAAATAAKVAGSVGSRPNNIDCR